MSQVRRRQILIAASALAAPTLLVAQPLGKRVPRVGWLVTGDPVSYRFSLTAFREGLSALNYIEGQTILIEYRWAEGDITRLPELARDLVRQKVEVIVTGGTVGAAAAKNATAVIPIVAAGAGDLVEADLVKSLARPGSNLTGVSVTSLESAAKPFEIMKEILPRSRRAAVLWGGGGQTSAVFAIRQRKIAEEAATSLSLTCSWHSPESVKELEDVLNATAKTRPDFLVVLSTPFYFTVRGTIAKVANQVQLPAIYTFREFVDVGGLISYGPSIADSYRRAAAYVDKILKGARPADLPVELPRTFELVVNMKTAKVLGIKIPQSVLFRADQVIE